MLQAAGNISAWPFSNVSIDAVTISLSLSTSEIPIGPSFPVTGTIALNVASGVTIKNTVITTILPPQVSCTGVTPASGGFAVSTAPLQNGVAQSLSGNTLVITAASLSGGTYTSTFTYFAPQKNADSIDTLNLANPQSTVYTSVQNATLDTLYILTSTLNTTARIVTPNVNVRLAWLTSYTTWDSFTNLGSAGVTPTDSLRWRLIYSISDYYNATSLMMTASLSDGHRYNLSAATPTVSFTSGTINVTPLVDTSDIGNDSNAATTGKTLLTFNITGARIANSLSATVVGPQVSKALSFVATILEQYSDTPFATPLYHGDPVKVTSGAFDKALLIQSTSATAYIESGNVQLSFYAVDDVLTGSSSPDVVAEVKVTFRFTYPLPSSDYKQLKLVVLMPQPVLLAADISAVNNSVLSQALVPARGIVTPGPTNTLSLSSATLTVSQQSIELAWPTSSDVTNTARQIDLLMTFKIQNVNWFIDRFRFTTIAIVTENGLTSTSTGAVRLRVPQLEARASVVSSSNTQAYLTSESTGARVTNCVVCAQLASPIGCPANYSGLDFETEFARTTGFAYTLNAVEAGDTVSALLVLRNNGGGWAFGVGFRLEYPSTQISASTPNVCVFDSSGTALATTGTSLLDANGLALVDTNPGQLIGSIAPGASDQTAVSRTMAMTSVNFGISSTLPVGSSVLSIFKLCSYYNSPSGTNLVSGYAEAGHACVEYPFRVKSANPSLDFVRVATSITSTGNAMGNSSLPDLAVGETAQYTVTITMPKGTYTNLNLVVRSPNGLISAATVVSVGPSVFGSSISAGGAATLSAAADNGTFTFGSVSVPSSASSTQTIVLSITAAPTSQSLATKLFSIAFLLNNNASVVSQGSETFDVVVPSISVSKLFLTSPVDASNSMPVSLTFSHAGTSETSAFGLQIFDAIPSALVFSAGSVTVTLNGSPVSGGQYTATANATTVSVSMLSTFEFPLAGSLVVSYQCTVSTSIVSGANYTSNATMSYFSAPSGSARLIATTSASGAFSAKTSAVVVSVGPAGTSLAETGSRGSPAVPDLAIGERLTMRTTITLIAGTTPFALRVDLPSTGELNFVAASTAVVSTGGLSGSDGLSFSDGYAGVYANGNLRVDFNSSAIVSSVASKILIIDATFLVADVAASTNDKRLNAVVAFDHQSSVTTTSFPITVVLPVVDQSVTVNTTSNVDAGDSLRYTFTFTHNAASLAPAFGLQLSATFPTNITLLAVSSSIGSSVIGTQTTSAFSITLPVLLSSGGTTTWTVTLTASARDTMIVGGTTVTANFDSYLQTSNSTQFRPFNTSRSAAFTTKTSTQSIALFSSDISETVSPNFVVGEKVVFYVTTRFAEGTSSADVSLLFNSNAVGRLIPTAASIVSIGSRLTCAGLTLGTAWSVSSTQANLTLPSAVVNAADNVADANDDIVFSVSATVADAGGTTSFTARMATTFNGGLYGTVTTFTMNVAQNVPSLALVASGATNVEYTRVVSFNSTLSTAGYSSYDVTVTIAVPSGMSLNTSSVALIPSNLPAVTIVTNNASMLIYTVNRINTTVPITVSYTTTVGAGITPASSLVTSSSVVCYTVPIANGVTRALTATANHATTTGSNTAASVIAINSTTISDTANPSITIGEQLVITASTILIRGVSDLTMVTTGAPLTYVSSIAYNFGVDLIPSTLSWNSAPSGTSDSNSDGRIDRASFAFGLVVNNVSSQTTNGALVATSATFSVPDVALLVDQYSFNAVVSVTTGAASSSFNVPLTIVLPTLSSTFVTDKTSGDAGDLVTSTLTFSHSAASHSTAFSITYGVSFHSNAIFTTGSVVVTSGATWIVTTVSGGFNLTCASFPLGSTASITWTFKIADSAVLASTFSSQTSTLRYFSAPSSAGRLVATGPFTTSFTMASSLAGSYFALSSVAWPQNDATCLNVGGRATFNVSVALPEGTTPLNVSIDAFPANFDLLDAKVLAISSGITSPTLSVGSGPTSGALTVNPAVFNFGTIVNQGTNVAGKVIVLQVTVRLNNNAGNTAGAALGLSVTISSAGSTTQTVATPAGLRVCKPNLNVVTSMSTTSGDALTTTTHTITLTQVAGTAVGRATNVTVTALLPASQIYNGSPSVTGTLNGSPSALVSAGPQNVTFTVDFMEASSSVVISFQALIQLTARPTQTLSTTYSVNYASNIQDYALTTTSGTSRTFTLSATLNTVNSSLSSTSLAATSGLNLTPGETFNMTIFVPFTRGTSTLTLTLTSTVPAGLAVTAANVLYAGTGISSLGSLAIGSAATTLTATNAVFSFGDIVNNATVASLQNTLSVSLQGVLLPSGTLTNGVTSRISTSAVIQGTTRSAAQVIFSTVEPSLSGSGVLNVTSGDAADAVLVTYTIANTGTATAYNLRFNLTMATHSILAAQATVSIGGVAVSASLWRVLVSGGAVAQFQIDTFATGAGSLVITVPAIVLDQAVFGSTLTPSSTLQYQSHPTDALGRQYSISPAVGTGFTMRASYSSSTLIVFSSTMNQINNRLSPGEYVTLRLSATMPEGKTAFQASISLPTVSGGSPLPILNLVSASIVSIGSQFTSSSSTLVSTFRSNPTSAVPTLFDTNSDGVSDRAVFDFGTGLINSGDNNVGSAGHTIDFNIVCELVNSAAVVAGLAITPTASLAFQTTTVALTGPTLVVADPVISGSMVFNTTSVQSSSVIDVTITLLHTLPGVTSTGNATDIVLTATIPSQFRLPASYTPTLVGAASSWTFQSSNVNELIVRVPNFMVSSSLLTLNYQLIVNSVVRPGDSLTSSISIVYKSAPDSYSLGSRRTRSLSYSASAFVQSSSGANTLTVTSSTLSATSGLNLNIGETILMRGRAVLVAGTSSLVLTVRIFNPALELVSATVDAFDTSLTSSVGALVVGNAFTVSAAGPVTDTASLNFGDVVFNGGTTGNIDVAIVARVPDSATYGIVGVSAGVFFNVKTNAENTTLSSAVLVTGPTLVSTGAISISSGDAGDSARLTATTGHLSSTGPAYNISVVVLHPGLKVSIGAIQANLPVGATGSAVELLNGGFGFRVIIDFLPTAAGSIVVTADTIIADSVRAGSTISAPIATVGYSSFPNSSSTSTIGRWKTATTTGFTATSMTTSVGPARLDIVPSLGRTGFTSIGELITYRVSVPLVEGTSNLVILAQLATVGSAPRMVITRAAVVSVGTGIDTSTSPLLASSSPGATSDTNADGQLDRAVFDFGTGLVNRGDNIRAGANDEIVIEVDCFLYNHAGVVSGQLIASAINVTVETAFFSLPALHTVVQPSLNFTVTTPVLSGMAGTSVPVILSVSHLAASTGAAKNVNLTVSLPAAITLSSLSDVSVSSASIASFIVGPGGLVQATIASLELGSTASITCNVVITDSVRPGSSHVISSTVGYGSAPTGSPDTRVLSLATPRTFTTLPTTLMSTWSIYSSDLTLTASNTLNVGELVTLYGRVVLVDGTSYLTATLSPPSAVLDVVSTQIQSIGSRVSTALAFGSPATSLSWSLGDVVVAGDGSTDNGTDFIVFSVTGRIADRGASASGASVNFGFGFTTDGETPSFSQTLSISEPFLQASGKLFSAAGDAGDTVLLTTSINHTSVSTGPAYAITLNYTLPDMIAQNVSIFLNGVPLSTSLWSIANSVQGNLVVVANDFAFSAVSNLTAQIYCIIADSARAGSTLIPTATLSWASHSNAAYARSRTSSVPLKGNFTMVSLLPVRPQFSLVSTTLNRSASVLAVGETAIFAVTVTLAEGTTSLVISANGSTAAALPLLSISSATVVSVGSSIDVSSSLLLQQESPDATLFDTNGDGVANSAVFDFGNVLKDAADNNLTAGDSIVVWVAFFVSDATSVVNGTVVSLTLSASTETDSASFSTSFTVLETFLTASSSLPVGVVAAGSLVPHTVAISHTSQSNAASYSVRVTTVLSDHFELASISSISVNGSSFSPSWFVVSANASYVEVLVFSLPLGNSVSVSFTTLLRDAVRPGQQLAAVSSVDYSSVPLDVGALPRHRLLPLSAFLNVSSSTGLTRFTLNGTDVATTSGLDLAVGEQVTFRALVVLVDGTSDLILRVKLPVLPALAPSPLMLESAYIESIGADLSSASSAALLRVGHAPSSLNDTNSDGLVDTIEWKFEDIINVRSGSSTSARDEISFKVVARLRDVPSVINGGAIGDGVKCDFDITGESLSFTVPLTAVQAKLVNSADLSFTSGDSADIVAVSLTVDHDVSSLSSAFNVVLDLVLPQMTLLPNTTVSVQIGGVEITSWRILSFEEISATTSHLKVIIDQFDRSIGSSAVLTAYASIKDSAYVGSTIYPSANVSWGTHPSSNQSRPGFQNSTVPSFEMLPNKPRSQGSFSVNVTSVSLTELPEVSLGETIDFDILFLLKEGTSDIIVDLLVPQASPTGLLITAASISAVGSSLHSSSNFMLSTSPAYNATAGSCTLFSNATHVRFVLNGVVNVGDNLFDYEDALFFRVTARVLGMPQQSRGIALTSGVSIAASGTSGASVEVAGSPLQVVVVEPELELSVGTVSPSQAGDIITHSVKVSHSALSNSAAYNLDMIVILHPNERIIPFGWNISSPLATYSELEDLTQFNVDLATLEVGEDLEVTFQMVLLDSTVLSSSLNHSIVLTYDSFPSTSTSRAYGPTIVQGSTPTLGAVRDFAVQVQPAHGDSHPGVGEPFDVVANISLFEGTHVGLSFNISLTNSTTSPPIVADSALVNGIVVSGVQMTPLTQSGVVYGYNFVFPTFVKPATTENSSLADPDLRLTVRAHVADPATSNSTLGGSLSVLLSSVVNSTTFEVEVGAPALVVFAVVVPDPVDLLQSVQVRLNVSHDLLVSESSAFGVHLTHSLPSTMRLIVGSVSGTSGVSVLSGNAGGDATNVVRVSISSLTLAQVSSLITFNVTIVDSSAGELLKHNSSLSLSSSNSATSSASYGPFEFFFDVENGFPQLQIRRNTTTAAFSPSRVPAAPNGTYAAVGDQVLVVLTLQMPAQTSNALVRVSSSVGLTPLSGVVTLVGSALDIAQANIAVNFTAAISSFPGAATFDVGRVACARGGFPDATRAIEFRVVLRVTDLVALPGAELPIDALVSYDGGQTSKSTQTQLVLVKPELQITVYPLVQVSGDIVKVTISVRHTPQSTSAAFGVATRVDFDASVVAVDHWDSFLRSSNETESSIALMNSSVISYDDTMPAQNVSFYLRILPTSDSTTPVAITATLMWSTCPDIARAQNLSVSSSASLQRLIPLVEIDVTGRRPDPVESIGSTIIGVGYRLLLVSSVELAVGSYPDSVVVVRFPRGLIASMNDVTLRARPELTASNVNDMTNSSKRAVLDDSEWQTWGPSSWNSSATMSGSYNSSSGTTLTINLGAIVSSTPLPGNYSNTLEFQFSAIVANLAVVQPGLVINGISFNFATANGLTASGSSRSIYVAEQTVAKSDVAPWSIPIVIPDQETMTSVRIRNPVTATSATAYEVRLNVFWNATEMYLINFNTTLSGNVTEPEPTQSRGFLRLFLHELDLGEYFDLRLYMAMNRTSTFLYGNTSVFFQLIWRSISPLDTGSDVSRDLSVSFSTFLTMNAAPNFRAASTNFLQSYTTAALPVDFKLDEYVRDYNANGTEVDIASLDVIQPPVNGSLAIISNSSASGGLIRYTPRRDAVPGSVIPSTVRLCDFYGECLNVSLVINLLDAPIGVADQQIVPSSSSSVSFRPLLNDILVDRQSLYFDDLSFNITTPPQYGNLTIRSVPNFTGVGDQFNDTRATLAAKNWTIELTYDLDPKYADQEAREELQYTVCDNNGVCIATPAQISIHKLAPTSAVIGIDPRGWCVAGTISTSVSTILGFAGPMLPNLVWYTLEYEQYIAYSSLLAGKHLPPDNYTMFSDCFMWTMANLPQPGSVRSTPPRFYGKRAQLDNDSAPIFVEPPAVTSLDSWLAKIGVELNSFFAVHLFWLFIALIVFVLAGVILFILPVCLHFHEDYNEDSEATVQKTKKKEDINLYKAATQPWTTSRIKLQIIGILVRFAYFCYMPVLMWMFFSAVAGVYVTLLALIYLVLVPAAYFGWWFMNRDDLDLARERVSSFDIPGVLYLMYKRGYELWPLLVIAKWWLIAIAVAFIARGSMVAGCIMLILFSLIYFALVLWRKPHVRRWAFIKDLVLSGGQAWTAFLLIFVLARLMTSWVLIVFHILILIALILLDAVSFALWVMQYLKEHRVGAEPKTHAVKQKNDPKPPSPEPSPRFLEAAPKSLPNAASSETDEPEEDPESSESSQSSSSSAKQGEDETQDPEASESNPASADPDNSSDGDQDTSESDTGEVESSSERK